MDGDVNSVLLEPVIDTVYYIVPVMGILQVHWLKKTNLNTIKVCEIEMAKMWSRKRTL